MFYLKSISCRIKSQWLNPGIAFDYKFIWSKNINILQKTVSNIYIKSISSLLLDAEVTVKRKKAGSPAITLQIKNPPAEISVDIILTLEVQQSWPPSTQDGLKIEQWLGRKVRGEFRNKSLYLVAKQNQKEKVLRGTLEYNRLRNIFSTTWSLLQVLWKGYPVSVQYSAFEVQIFTLSWIYPGQKQLKSFFKTRFVTLLILYRNLKTKLLCQAVH